MAGPRRRFDILTLPAQQITQLTNAFNVLKTNGTYDGFIRRHMTAAMTPTPAGSTQTNAAHCGPTFLPWHRAALWELETALIAVDPTITGIPYWRWENEASLNAGNPKLSALWTAAYFGGDGDPTQGNRVVHGPFATWQALIWNNTTHTFSSRSPAGLIRRLGRDPAGLTTLPNQAQVTDANSYTTYDGAPYDKTSASFRNRVEGWASTSRMHNQVHRWIGGDMLAGTSPNDPLFWLHHANVDRIWWAWQRGATPLRPYLPASPSGPIGQRSNDRLVGLLRSDWTPNLVQDIGNTTNLGYEYV